MKIYKYEEDLLEEIIPNIKNYHICIQLYTVDLYLDDFHLQIPRRIFCEAMLKYYGITDYEFL